MLIRTQMQMRGLVPQSRRGVAMASAAPWHKQLSPKVSSASEKESYEHKRMLECTEQEERVFATLVELVHEKGLDVTLRAAGGWVRDKLLGQHKSSPDVDLAIDTMHGKALAEKVSEKLRDENASIDNTSSSPKVGVIAANPEQSKHLETATMRIHGISIDFVNLRAEEYSQGSRIPVARFGTPEEDAFRRDLTINALFYNLHTRCIEDYTQMGLQDLQERRVRTPLPPRQTLLDDPLRALRAIRFATRFGFALDTDLQHACADAEVQDALRQKVSRERVGIELDGMLSGPAPHRSLCFITFLGLFLPTFDPGIQLPPNTDWQCAYCSHILNELLNRVGSCTSEPAFNDDSLRLLRLAAYLLPLKELQVASGKRKRQTWLSDAIVRNSLKLKAKDAEAMPHLHSCGSGFNELLAHAVNPSRRDIGVHIREGKSMWREALLLGAVLLEHDVHILPVSLQIPQELTQALERVASKTEERIPNIQNIEGIDVDGNADERIDTVPRAAERAFWLLARIESEDLRNVWQEKPMLDGKQVMAVLGWSKGGPELGKALNCLMEWQLNNPGASEDDARNFLKQQWQQ